MALLGTGCYDTSDPPKQETIPPGPDVSPPAITPSAASPAPSVSVNAAAGCANLQQVVDALIYADPDSPPAPEAKLVAAPVCAAGWAFAEVSAPNTENARIVLRHHAGRWQVLTYGTRAVQRAPGGGRPGQGPGRGGLLAVRSRQRRGRLVAAAGRRARAG